MKRSHLHIPSGTLQVETLNVGSIHQFLWDLTSLRVSCDLQPDILDHFIKHQTYSEHFIHFHCGLQFVFLLHLATWWFLCSLWPWCRGSTCREPIHGDGKRPAVLFVKPNSIGELWNNNLRLKKNGDQHILMRRWAIESKELFDKWISSKFFKDRPIRWQWSFTVHMPSACTRALSRLSGIWKPLNQKTAGSPFSAHSSRG